MCGRRLELPVDAGNCRIHLLLLQVNAHFKLCHFKQSSNNTLRTCWRAIDESWHRPMSRGLSRLFLARMKAFLGSLALPDENSWTGHRHGVTWESPEELSLSTLMAELLRSRSRCTKRSPRYYYANINKAMISTTGKSPLFPIHPPAYALSFHPTMNLKQNFKRIRIKIKRIFLKHDESPGLSTDSELDSSRFALDLLQLLVDLLGGVVQVCPVIALVLHPIQVVIGRIQVRRQ
jgi:hypothetical protein